jgi:hypothetical protein
MYEAVTNLIKKYKWEDVKDFEGIFELKKNLTYCYLFMDVFNTPEEFEIMKDLSKFNDHYCAIIDYKPGYFSKTYSNVIDGNGVLLAFKLFDYFRFYTPKLNIFKVTILNYKEREPENLIKNFLKIGGLIPLNPTIRDLNDEEELDSFIKKLKENPTDFYFQIPFNNFDPYNYGDNERICNISRVKDPEEYDFLSLSQFILNQGLYLYNLITNSNPEIESFIIEPKYIQFLQGISYFQDCDIFSIPYDENDKSRLAFLLNLYQIMLIHFIINDFQKKTKIKSGLLSYFKNDIAITYKFKNMTLNNLELKHVVFRNNKPIPGSYMKLVYNTDIKCKILPDFDDLRVLLILYEFKKNLKRHFVIFNKKEVLEQLNDVVFDFIIKDIYFNNEDSLLLICDVIEPYLTDFGSTDTSEKPEKFLEFIFNYLNIHREYSTKKPTQIYKTKINEKEMKLIKYLNPQLISDINNNLISIEYIY